MTSFRWRAILVLGALAMIAGCDGRDPCEREASRVGECMGVIFNGEGGLIVCKNESLCLAECTLDLDPDCDAINDAIAGALTERSRPLRHCWSACTATWH
jgi:hypothetical protein